MAERGRKGKAGKFNHGGAEARRDTGRRRPATSRPPSFPRKRESSDSPCKRDRIMPARASMMRESQPLERLDNTVIHWFQV